MGIRDYWKLWRFVVAVRSAGRSGMWKSKKFWAAVIGALIVVLGKQAGLSEETSQQIAALVVAYIVGQGIADAGKEKAKVDGGKKQ